jgi:hypothetical protein
MIESCHKAGKWDEGLTRVRKNREALKSATFQPHSSTHVSPIQQFATSFEYAVMVIAIDLSKLFIISCVLGVTTSALLMATYGLFRLIHGMLTD